MLMGYELKDYKTQYYYCNIKDLPKCLMQVAHWTKQTNAYVVNIMVQLSGDYYEVYVHYTGEWVEPYNG